MSTRLLTCPPRLLRDTAPARSVRMRVYGQLRAVRGCKNSASQPAKLNPASGEMFRAFAGSSSFASRFVKPSDEILLCDGS